MRRSTLFRPEQAHKRCAYSAHAEVYPRAPARCALTPSLLRACGGLPRRSELRRESRMPTPRMRRSTRGQLVLVMIRRAYSAHAEVYPGYRPREARWPSLLRACGGLPVHRHCCTPGGRPTPRMRRSTLDLSQHVDKGGAYSAHAEVYPGPRARPRSTQRLLRACGGLPRARYRHDSHRPPTPRMRRSTLQRDPAGQLQRAYSAHAEVYPRFTPAYIYRHGLLRACGGLPNTIRRYRRHLEPTPRMRRSTPSIADVVEHL